MKKTYFQKTMDKLSAEKEESIQRLAKIPFDDLHSYKKELFELHLAAKEVGYKEASEVHYYKYLIVDEAIEVKTGTEEQAWDYLT